MVTPKQPLFFIGLFIFILCLAPALHAAEIKVFVDQQQLRVDQSFQLFFEATDEVDADPDFSPLSHNFEVLGKNLSSSTSFINGSFSSKKTWILTLMAKRHGDLEIPSIAFGRDSSSVLRVKVSQSNEPNSAAQNKEIYLEVEVDPQAVYVQQQLTYILRLFRRVEISSASLSEPTFTNIECIVEKIGQDQNFEKIVNGRRYLVVERTYAIFPQQSGQLIIDPVQFKGQLLQAQRSFFGSVSQAGPIRKVSSKQVSIAIKPIPASFSGKRWLPAENLQINEIWSTDPDQLKAGEPATRTLKLTARGVLAHQFPELSTTAIPGFKLYPDQPKVENSYQDLLTTALREEKLAVIAVQAGTHQLPEMKLEWWNTKTDRAETAIIPATAIKVIGAKLPPVSQQPEVREQTTSTTEVEILPASNQITPPTLWIAISASLALGWLLTTLAWWRSSKRTGSNKPAGKQQPAEKSQISKNLKLACRNNDPTAAGKALLAWGQQTWQQNPPTNLTDLGNRCGAEIGKEVARLSKHLYGQRTESWNGEQLWQTFGKISVKTDSDRKTKQSPLAKLYPE